MEKPLSEEIVDSILDGNKESFMAAFQAAIAAKVTDALEVKKVEIASTLITPEVAVEEEIDLDESKGEMDDEDEKKEEDEDSEDMKEEEQTDEAIRVVDRWYPGVPFDPRKRKDVANTVRRIRQHPNARGGMTGFNKYQDFFGGHNVRLGAEREETVNNKMTTIKEDLGSAYEEIMASHHSARQKGRDALAAGNHAAAENHFVSAGLHLSKAEEVAKDYFKFHGVELHKPNHPRYSPYITGNWDKVT